MKVKTYNRSTIYNALHTIIVNFSPRVPRAQRRSLATIASRNRENTRRNRFNRVVTTK